MTRPVYKLTPTELHCAAMCGVARRITGIFEGYNSKKHTDRKSDWATDIDGACAELVVAKHFGCYWMPTNRSFKAPDVLDYQVRSTSHPEGHLIIRPDDADAIYILVYTRPPNFVICGWFSATSAKIDRYWREDSWWVPQADLHDIDDLPASWEAAA